MKRYTKQSSRGKEGYGYVSIDRNHVVKNFFHSCGEKEIRDMIMGDTCKTILFHHRKPTSTPNLPECAHPILVSKEGLNYDYYVVHNGVIHNASELKKSFEEEGFVFTTAIEQLYKSKITGQEYSKDEKFNDSEAFAIDLVKNIENDTNDIKSRGSIAFVALQCDKETREILGVFYGRNASNPLKLDKSEDSFILASEGAGIDVETNTLFYYDLTTKTTHNSKMTFGLDVVRHTPSQSTYKPEHSHKPVDKPPFGFLGGTTTPKNPMDVVKETSHEQVIAGKTIGSKNIDELKSQLCTRTVKFADKREKEIGTIDLYFEDGSKRTISFYIEGDKLAKTRISLFNIHHITTTEWIEYQSIEKDIADYIGMRKEISDPNHKDYMLINGELKKLHMEMNEFSDRITRRINSKF